MLRPRLSAPRRAPVWRAAVGIAATAALGALSSACSYATVGSGEVGVVWTPTGTRDNVYPEGQWTIGGDDRATIYNARSQEREERLEVLAANGLRIVLDASMRYHIVREEAVLLHKDLGAPYYEILLGPTLKSQARRVVGRYQPEEIYSTQREVIERQIREGIEAAIKGRHIALEGVLIRNVTLPESIQAAINDKLQAEQMALKMKFTIEQAQKEAEKKLVEAKAETERQKMAALAQAEVERIAAQGQADAKRIEAQATDDYERVVQQHMSDRMLRWQQIAAMKDLSESTNAKVIMMGGAGEKGATILDVK
jgi:regulator of protease activity HflC (stomatin/prohibitin superfamily)